MTDNFNMAIEIPSTAAEDLKLILEHLKARTPIPADVQMRVREKAEAVTKSLPPTNIAIRYVRELRDQ